MDAWVGIEVTPRVRAMVGSLRGAVVTEEDYRRYLAEKYGCAPLTGGPRRRVDALPDNDADSSVD